MGRRAVGTMTTVNKGLAPAAGTATKEHKNQSESYQTYALWYPLPQHGLPRARLGWGGCCPGEGSSSRGVTVHAVGIREQQRRASDALEGFRKGTQRRRAGLQRTTR